MRADRVEEWTKWRGLVNGQRQSGQNVAIFCREHGLREWQFYAWKKRLREGETAQFVEVQVKSVGKVAEAKPAAGGAIEIRLSSGRSLVVGVEFDASHLRALLAVLEPGA
jgi:transposase-like protein